MRHLVLTNFVKLIVTILGSLVKKNLANKTIIVELSTPMEHSDL
jgi:hypothetical protein